MGIIRSTPDSNVNIKSSNLSDLNYIEASVCGWQHYMEDYTRFSKINDKVSVFYVIDGHSGPDVAQIASQIIPIILKQSQYIERQQYKTAIEKMFEKLDDSIRKQGAKASQIRQNNGMPKLSDKQPIAGCSIAIALIGQNEIIIANVGQCKSYVSYYANQSKIVLLSGNHTVQNQQDESRVKNAGGYFINEKLNGMFPFTRSIGDYHFKNDKLLKPNQQLLVATPSIFSLRKGDIKLIVMGTSGLWQKTNFVLKQIAQDDVELNQLQLKSKKLLSSLICKNPRQSDLGLKNMSLLVIDLKNR